MAVYADLAWGAGHAVAVRVPVARGSPLTVPLTIHGPPPPPAAPATAYRRRRCGSRGRRPWSRRPWAPWPAGSTGSPPCWPTRRLVRRSAGIRDGTLELRLRPFELAADGPYTWSIVWKDAPAETLAAAVKHHRGEPATLTQSVTLRATGRTAFTVARTLTERPDGPIAP